MPFSESRLPAETLGEIVPQDPADTTRSVLIVEDDPDAELLLRRMVGVHDPRARILAAREAVGARNLMEHKEFALVICDWNLAEHTSGLDLWRYRLLRELPTPFLFVSGTRAFGAMPTPGENFFFLPKPIYPAQAAAILRRLMPNGKRAEG